MTTFAQRSTILTTGAIAVTLLGCERPSAEAPAGADPAPVPTAPATAASTNAAPDGTPSPDASRIRLTDVTADSGIEMTMVSGTLPSSEILEVNGGGLAAIDFDADGDLDLFVANGATMDDPETGPGCRLYRNVGRLRFEDATADTGIALHRWAMGVAAADYDGDGHTDLYVTCFGPNVLLRNTGDGRFEDVTNRAGVGDARWGTSSTFGDVDADGDLDLYVVNYLEFDVNARPPRARHKDVTVMAGPNGLVAQHDVLYENLGDGTFRDVTEVSGCQPPRAAYGLNALMLDFDADGRTDIFVGNDSMANFLYRNLGRADGHPRFEEIGLTTGIASNMDGSNQATMGIALGDVDGNGQPDVFTTNFSNDTNTLHANLDGRFFDDRTRQFGLGQVSRPYLGWACGFHDLDHDGDEDLLIFNGHVYPEATMATMDSAYEQTALLFERDGARFRRVDAETAGAWLDERHRDRTAVWADFDRDGDLDVIVGELNGPIRVLRNEIATDARDWLIVELRDERQFSRNPACLGSRLELDIGSSPAPVRWIYSGGAFQSAQPASAHFGIPAGAEIGRLTITWPDGSTDTATVGGVGRTLVVRRTDRGLSVTGRR